MPQFRLTQKYAKDCHVSVLSDPQPIEHPLDDWFIDVIRVNRKKIAVATHAKSAFSLFIPYAEAGSAVAIPEGIGILLKEFLCFHDLLEWAEQIDVLFSGTVRFCKTIDRKILGHMNDFKRCIACYVQYSPVCVHPIHWGQIADMINNMPVNLAAAGGYIYPTEALGQLLGKSIKKTAANKSLKECTQIEFYSRHD